MRRCPLDCELITDFDLFGKDPEFFYKGKSQRKSWFGQIFSVLYIALYIAFLIYKLVRMLRKVDIDFYETYAFSGIPTIQLNNDLFYGGFSVGSVIDETIYFPVVYHYTETMDKGEKQTTKESVELTTCSLDKFGKRFQPLFAEAKMENLYCMKNVKETLAGYSNLDVYSYYYISIVPCIGYNLKGEQCQDPSIVSNFFEQNILEFKLQDVVMTPKNYDNPSEARTMDIRAPIFSGLFQNIYTYLQIVNLETDQDWVGFEALSDIKKEQFLRYEESWIVAAPSPHMHGLVQGIPVTTVTIQLSAKVLTTKRTNTKMIELLGDVGGLMEVVSSVFNIISIFIADLLYDIDIVNTLFSFDLSRKVVMMKKDKNEIVKLSEQDDINIYNRKKDKKNMTNIKFKLPPDNFEENKSNNKMAVTPSVEKVKLKKKKKLKYSRTMSSGRYAQEESKKNLDAKKQDANTNNENKINELEKNTILSNNLMMSSDNIRDKKREEIGMTSDIIDEIKINRFFIVFAFCCIRKRKNVNNFVLEEGLNIIRKRLDVLNIFKRLYFDEKSQESLLKEKEEISMSDDCKEKLL